MLWQEWQNCERECFLPSKVSQLMHRMTAHFTANCILFTTLANVHSKHCILYTTIQFTLYIVHCTHYTMHCKLYTLHCTMYTVHNILNCELYNVYFTMPCTDYCALYR